MTQGRCVTAKRRSGTAGVAALLLVLSTGAALAAKPSVPPITVSDIVIDQTSLQSGQALRVTYTLSHPASDQGVKVEFVRNGTVVKTVAFAAGTPEAAAGTHTAVVDTTGLGNGSYTVRVSAPNGVTSSFINVADTGNTALHFYSPRGVDVNKVAGSPAFGRIYVVETNGGGTTGRTTEDGVYALNPDLTPVYPTAKVTGNDLGALFYDPWLTDRTSSPYRLSVGPDGLVYITDASDPHSGIFVASADLNTVNPLLFFPNGPHDQPVLNNNNGSPMYGSIMAAWVEGTGDNRKVYTLDEDLTPNLSIYRYDIPVGTTDANVTPTLALDTNGQVATWDAADFVRDAQGNYYVISSGLNNAVKFDAAGQQLGTLPATGNGYQGIAIDESRNRIAIASTGGRVFLTTKDFSSVTPLAVGSGNNRDVAFDAEGWLYVTNSTDEQLYVLAAPGAPVTGGSAAAAQALSVVSPLPGDIAPVGPEGLFVGPNGQKYGDGKVDIKDAAYALRVAAGLNTIP